MTTCTKPLHLIGMGGLGDCVYQRPLLRHLLQQRGEFWFSTPYPELVEDLPGVHPVRWSSMRLRCQSRNMAQTSAETWTAPPRGGQRVKVIYALQSLRMSVVEEMEWWARTPIKDFRFDLPEFGPSSVQGRYAVIRPVSVRREWTNHARNPDPAYLTQAAEELQRRGLRVICVGDIDETNETLVGQMPPADVYLTRGELSTRQLFALVKHATLVVGGTGWVVPTCLAYRTPAVILGGGLAQHSAPQFLVDPRMDASRMRFLLPQPYCWCRNPKHPCRKEIPEFLPKLRAALSELL